MDLTIDLDTLTQLRADYTVNDRLGGPPYEDESYNASANRLFVRAAELIQAAEGGARAWRRLGLLKNARSRLEAIVDHFPASGLAVKLISGQRVGTVSLADLGDAIETAAARACPQAPTPAGVLSMAVSAATAVEGRMGQVLALFWIAEAQTRMGDLGQARKILGADLATAKKNLIPNRKWEMYNTIIWTPAKTGGEDAEESFASRPFGIALATGEKIEVSIADYNNYFTNDDGNRYRFDFEEDHRNSYYRNDRGLVGKAMAQAGAGQIAEAFATAEKINHSVCRARVFVGIVGTRVKKGDIAEALATAGKIRDADCRAWASVGIVGAQAKAGRVAEAFATAARIEDAYSPWALVEIANALAETG